MAFLAGLALVAVLIGVVVAVRRFRAQRREVDRIRTLFSRYVTPTIVDELLRRKDPRVHTGRSMQATILVCRIWNFADFTEKLTPEETLRYLNEFFTLAGTSIQKHRGMVEKFLSDGMIGVFGIPLEDPFQEENALRAALDIVRLVDAMTARWQKQGRRPFQVGIGVSSGTVIAGDAGFHERREFAVVGPETLYASQLQAATVDLNAYIIASAATCEPVRDLFALVPIKRVPLRGTKRLTETFIVRGLARRDRDDLRMPASRDFTHTTIVPPETPVPQAQPQAKPVAPRVQQPEPAHNASPLPPEVTPLPRIDLPDPPPPMRRRRRAVSNAVAFDLPELRIPQFYDDDSERPILPEPPQPRAVYEDSGGPPIQLPP
jgi:class 3 adenylate cyclase